MVYVSYVIVLEQAYVSKGLHVEVGILGTEYTNFTSDVCHPGKDVSDLRRHILPIRCERTRKLLQLHRKDIKIKRRHLER